MKKIFLLIMLLFAFFAVKAQDTIVLKNAIEIDAKVSTLTHDSVTYKRWDNLDGPTYTISKSEVLYIKYKNGYKEIFQEQTAPARIKPVIKRAKANKPTIRYKGEVNLGFAVADKKPDIFGESFSKYDDGDYTSYSSSGSDTQHSDLSRPLLETIHGIEIGKYFFIGAGVGLQYFYGKLQDLYGWSNINKKNNDYKWNTLMLPIFVNFKAMYPVNDKFTPFLNLSIGGAVACISNLNYIHHEKSYREIKYSRKVHGGFYCDFGAGVRYKRLNLSMGMLYQTIKIGYDFYGPILSNDTETTLIGKVNGCSIVKFSSFYMKIGVNF